jgi:hypothetical protein
MEADMKKPKLGTGKRFAKLEGKLSKKGVDDPAALAAWIGRKKFGKKRFGRLSKGWTATRETLMAKKMPAGLAAYMAKKKGKGEAAGSAPPAKKGKKAKKLPPWLKPKDWSIAAHVWFSSPESCAVKRIGLVFVTSPPDPQRALADAQ